MRGWRAARHARPARRVLAAAKLVWVSDFAGGRGVAGRVPGGACGGRPFLLLSAPVLIASRRPPLPGRPCPPIQRRPWARLFNGVGKVGGFPRPALGRGSPPSRPSVRRRIRPRAAPPRDPPSSSLPVYDSRDEVTRGGAGRWRRVERTLGGGAPGEVVDFGGERLAVASRHWSPFPCGAVVVRTPVRLSQQLMQSSSFLVGCADRPAGERVRLAAGRYGSSGGGVWRWVATAAEDSPLYRRTAEGDGGRLPVRGRPRLSFRQTC